MKQLFWIIGAAILFFDRVTKYMALRYCVSGIFFNSYLSCTLSLNRGITWGFFHSHETVPFMIATGLIIGVTGVLCYYTYQRSTQGYAVMGENFIIFGSISNIIDRICYGGVIDFIALSYQDWIWPSFNGADIFIVIGIICMLYEHNN